MWHRRTFHLYQWPPTFHALSVCLSSSAAVKTCAAMTTGKLADLLTCVLQPTRQCRAWNPTNDLKGEARQEHYGLHDPSVFQSKIQLVLDRNKNLENYQVTALCVFAHIPRGKLWNSVSFKYQLHLWCS